MAEIFIERFLCFWLQIDHVFNVLCNASIKKLHKGVSLFRDVPLQKAKIKLAEKEKARANVFNGDDYVDEARHVDEGFSEPSNLIEAYGELQMKYPEFSNQDLINEITTLFATGTDTSGLFSASILLAVAFHREIQDKLYDEILSVVGKKGDISTKDFLKMPYLDQVYNETLRFFHIIPFIARRTTNDITISGSLIPAGVTVVCSLASLNRDPETFPNPKSFDPENFSPSNKRAKEKFAFLPFSGGARNCIGKQYAEMLGKIQVIHVLRNFEVSTNMDLYNLKQKLQITLVNVEGYNVFLKKRL